MSISEILASSKTIAVVGLSARRTRPSFGVSEYMQSMGYRIVPVNPNEREILGETVYAALDEIPHPVDIVNIFRLPEFVPDIVEAAIRIGAKTIWMQEGISHPAAAERAKQAGLAVISDKCILKEHRKLRV